MIKKERVKIAIEEAARRELVKNFEVGGRWGEGKFGGGTSKWKPSKRAIEQRGKTLMDTGRLFGTLRAEFVEKGNGVYELVLSTMPEYAVIHQYGTERVPKRPFMTLPDSFEDEAKKIIEENLDTGEILKRLL